MQHVRLAADLAILNVILFRPSRGIHDRDIPLAASGTLKSALHENIISERFEFMKPLRFRKHAEARERCPLASERPFKSLPGVPWRAALIRTACVTLKTTSGHPPTPHSYDQHGLYTPRARSS